MENETYNVYKVNKVNLLIIVITCSINFFQSLMTRSGGSLIGLLAPVIILILTVLMYSIKIGNYRVKAMAFSLIPSMVAITLFYKSQFTVDKHYILILALVMIAMYFEQKLIIIYLLIQDILIMGIIILKPHNFIIGAKINFNYDLVTVFIDFNILGLMLIFLTKWGKGLIQNTSMQNSELQRKNMEISGLYNQVAASEEELKWQYSTLEENQKKLEYLAFYDTLTELPNRSLFIDRLNMGINYALRNNDKLAVMFLDLDNFKIVNDSLGHNLGDELLKEISQRLKNIVIEGETLSRFGGDEYALILNNIDDYKKIIKLAQKISKAISEPVILNGQEIIISVSMGVAIYPEDGDNTEELLKSADTAMYKAKTNGKNGYQFFNKKMKQELIYKIQMEKNIREAIKKKEFILHFQPQIDVQNSCVRGFEALVRWNNSKGELIFPNEFIAIAEETGLIVELGAWVLMEACLKNKEWESLYNSKIIISVNISVVQLKQRNFVSTVKSVLAITGMKPEYLELEITESMLIESYDETIDSLKELRKMGILIALDDFGTGYSSLNHLKNLPIDTLKIDKTFIDGISSPNNGGDIVGSIITLVQKLGLKTIAEGVETKEQLDYLIENGCEHIQGYIYSKPVIASEVMNRLNADYNDYNFVI